MAEEVTVRGENTKRPDVVLYVNGIALGVLELKRSTVSVSEGIRQNLDNQKAVFIERFFTTVQLVMAGNDTEGLRYGVIGTPEKYYLSWKEESVIENLLDRQLTQLCEKRRFLEIIHDFIVFDAGVKKPCRTSQPQIAKLMHLSPNAPDVLWLVSVLMKSLLAQRQLKPGHS